MQLLDLIRPEHIIAPLRATDVRHALEQLVDRLERTDAIEPSATLRRRIRSEPLRDLVAVSDDVVLPHYRSEAVSDLMLALGTSADPIPAGEPGVEAKPRLIALILAPQAAASLYLQTTSTLARLLRMPGTVERLVSAGSPEAIMALPELQDIRIQPSLTVREVMVHRVHTVTPETSVRSTLDLMLRRRLHAVPVVGSKGEVLGLVTDSDLMRALLPHIPRAGDEQPRTAEDPANRPVREIMSRSILCVSEELGVNDAASMMINKDVEQLPVVQAGALTGMVTRTDIIRKLFGRG